MKKRQFLDILIQTFNRKSGFEPGLNLRSAACLSFEGMQKLYLLSRGTLTKTLISEHTAFVHMVQVANCSTLLDAQLKKVVLLAQLYIHSQLNNKESYTNSYSTAYLSKGGEWWGSPLYTKLLVVYDTRFSSSIFFMNQIALGPEYHIGAMVNF